jgi:hypothetical protein
MLNLLQHPATSPSRVEDWTLKQVQGHAYPLKVQLFTGSQGPSR